MCQQTHIVICVMRKVSQCKTGEHRRVDTVVKFIIGQWGWTYSPYSSGVLAGWLG